jgi:hypothetical protein
MPSTRPCTRWKLRELLASENISAYALARILSQQTRPNTIYRLVRKGKEPSRVDLSTLTLVVYGLRKLTGKPIEIGDILEYVG